MDGAVLLYRLLQTTADLHGNFYGRIYARILECMRPSLAKTNLKSSQRSWMESGKIGWI